MTTPNPKQQFTLLATMVENADWDSLTTEEVQLGITESRRAGAEFTLFVKNGFRMQTGNFLRNTGEFTVQILALPRPTLEQLRAKHSWIKSIERDTSPTGPVTMNLATVLRPEETRSINGAEYEHRLTPHLNDLLGFQQLEWLVEHQDENPVFKVLLGKIYVDGPGLVVTDAHDYRHIPYLRQGGQRWELRWYYLGNGFGGHGRVASSGK